ncbi:hypothetical protein KW783_00865 [Candidatus Parcubacteria bacterium]|nr:hypothetical protein [Candidatus Parcubacteria bacterium]
MASNGNHKKKHLHEVIEERALRFTKWVGSTSSIIFHTILFILVMVLGLLGYNWNNLLLILTTVVSLEAIYLSIFIQMTVNHTTESLKVVEEDIDEIQDDIDDIQEDVEEITIEEAEEEKEGETTQMTLEKIHVSMQKLMSDMEKLQQQEIKIK